MTLSVSQRERQIKEAFRDVLAGYKPDQEALARLGALREVPPAIQRTAYWWRSRIGQGAFTSAMAAGALQAVNVSVPNPKRKRDIMAPERKVVRMIYPVLEWEVWLTKFVGVLRRRTPQRDLPL